MTARHARFGPFVLAVVAFTVISVFAYAGMMPRVLTMGGVDKILHATMGATLTFFLARALSGKKWLAMAFVLVPLAIDEYLQRLSTSRSSDWGDLLADAIGALVAVIAYDVITGGGETK